MFKKKYLNVITLIIVLCIAMVFIFTKTRITRYHLNAFTDYDNYEPMSPTIMMSDTFDVDIRPDSLNQGDLVAVKVYEEGIGVSRIVAKPGDEVYLGFGNLYVNDVLFDESFLAEEQKSWYYGRPLENGEICHGKYFMMDGEYYKLADDEYFILNDNRDATSGTDHFHGVIKDYDIIGKVVNVYRGDAVIKENEL